MIFEHFAINVKNPVEVKEWYCQHLGLSVAKEMSEPPFMIFLADSSGRVVCEFYHRPEFQITEFSTQHHLTFHFAFESKNAEEDKKRLLNAGATFIEDIKTEDGSHMSMLRDPWGIPLQLCQRTHRMNRLTLP